jgi:hypothetical protein
LFTGLRQRPQLHLRRLAPAAVCRVDPDGRLRHLDHASPPPSELETGNSRFPIENQFRTLEILERSQTQTQKEQKFETAGCKNMQNFNES